MSPPTVKRVTRSELAKHLGVTAPYVTKLGRAGRLVFADETEHLIDLAATLQRIEATRDLARSQRAAPAGRGGRPSAYHAAQTRVSTATAVLRELEAQKLAGKLVEAGPILRALTDTHTAARNSILEQADRLAAVLASETDPLRVYDLLRADGEHICRTVQRAAEALQRRAGLDGPVEPPAP